MNVYLLFVTFLYTTKVNGQTKQQSFLSFISGGLEHKNGEIPNTKKLLDKYDFIIVGAGTAGCTLANRLTEISNWNILLIEAGDQEKFIMDVPIAVNYLQFTNANWGYRTEPSENFCLGLNDNRCKWPRGRVMGGSSVLNYMIYTRGNRRDYDKWEQLGNEGWGWKDVFPYFKKIEKFTIAEYQDPLYHNTEGPIDVSYVPFSTEVAKAWVKACQEAGHKLTDYNGATQTGTSLFQVNMRNGTRVSSNKGYLHPIKHRSNLHVMKNSLVTKILSDGNKTINGVEFVNHNKRFKIFAEKEVIISAGTINSPQLLMLSGIGPKKHLEKMKIPLIQDLKVGYNLMDHVSTGGVIFTLDKQNFSLSTREIFNNISILLEYLNYRTGPLTVPGGGEALAFVDLQNPLSTDGWPDMEIIFAGGALNGDPSAKINVGVKNQLYNAVFETIGDQQAFMVFPTLLRPKSRGIIKLKNTNPKTHPLIYPNYYSEKEDILTMLKGIKEGIRIAEQNTLQKLGTKLYRTPIPDCENLIFGTDPYWICAMKYLTLTFYHPSGTCKMGPNNDSSAVVGPRLKVHGVRGIRVIDASIIPEIPAAHTNVPVHMIAEKGADMIKEDWNVL